jgi:hypothetical protein
VKIRNLENFASVVQKWGKKNAMFFNILATMGKRRNTVCAEALTLLRSAVRRTGMSASQHGPTLTGETAASTSEV